MRGIYFEPSRNRWRARIYDSGRAVFCAYFATEEDAIAALTAAKPTLKPPPTQPPLQKLDLEDPARALVLLLAALADGLDTERRIA